MNQRQQMVDELSKSYGHLRQAAMHLASDASERLTPGYERAKVAAGHGWRSTRDAIVPAFEQMRPAYAQMRQGATRARMKGMQGAMNARMRGMQGMTNARMKGMQGATKAGMKGMKGATMMNARMMPMATVHLSRRQRKAMAAAAKHHRLRSLAGLLAAGAAVGAATAIVRRRRAAEWQQYHPMGAHDMAGAEHHGYEDAHYGQTRGRRFMRFGQSRYAAKMGREQGSAMDTFAGRAGRMGGMQAQHGAGPHGPHANGPFGAQGRAMSGAPGGPATGPAPAPGMTTRPGTPSATGPIVTHGAASASDMRSLNRASADRSPNERMAPRSDYRDRT